MKKILDSKIARTRLSQRLLSWLLPLLLMFAGNAYAGITVGLSIENDLDSNGNISVINGSKVKVAYAVTEDSDNDLNKKDKIQLLRVSDDSIVASVERGKKKSGTVSIKVKNSEDEQLYVRYIRKVSGDLVTRTSHPGDPGSIALLSIAKANTADLTVELNALRDSVEAQFAALAATSVPIIVKDSDSSVVGRLIATDEGYSWWVINSLKFIFELDGDGNLGVETLNFTGLNCTDTAYVPDEDTRVAFKQGYVFTDPTGGSVYYVSANTSKTSGASIQSKYEYSYTPPTVTVTCVNNSETIDGFQALYNVSGITGVPGTSFGPVSLQ